MPIGIAKDVSKQPEAKPVGMANLPAPPVAPPGFTDDNKGVWIIRHGRTALNKDGASAGTGDRIRGWRDVPLDEEGQKQALEIAQWAVRLKPALIYTSNLQRASFVASAIGQATGAPVKSDVAFRPWDVGHFSGQSSARVAPDLAKYVSTPDQPVPDGESFHNFAQRALGAFTHVMGQFLQTKENILVVTHYRDLVLLLAWLKEKGLGVDGAEFGRNHTEIPTGTAVRFFPRGDTWDFEIVPETGAKVGVQQQPQPSPAPPPVGLQRPSEKPPAKPVGVAPPPPARPPKPLGIAR
jgi:broad specificity phosphatase PhoE